MPGLVPGIHLLRAAVKAWMAETSPAITIVERSSAKRQHNAVHAAALRSIGLLSMLKRLNSVVNGLPSVARTMASDAATAS